jgi:hypothetical protein
MYSFVQEWNRAVAEGWVPPLLLGSMPASPATNWVPISEVAKHYRFEDAWTIIRGKVYNVTPYLKIHPGGEAQLMKVAGEWISCKAPLSLTYQSLFINCREGRHRHV